MLLPLVALALGADVDPFHVEAAVETLPNGLTVIVVENHRTDTIALHETFNVGSRDERDGEHGCAHLFEHLMFEGSANVPSNMFDQWLTEAGGENNAYTSEDETAYHMTFPSGALDRALFLESDRLGWLDAGLNPENVANQQSVVLQERAEGYAEPGGRDWDVASRLIFQADHPYHTPVIGTVADVRGFQVPAVVDFWRRHYTPGNAVLVLVGNLHTAMALDSVRRWFSDVPAREVRPRNVAPVASTVTGAAALVEDDVETRTVYLQWPTVQARHEDEAALDVLASVLSYGHGTRLDDALYYTHAIASDVGAFHQSQELAGGFYIYASSPNVPLRRLERKAIRVVEGLTRAPPTTAEVNRARAGIRASLLDALEAPADVAEHVADCWRLTGKADCMPDLWARYEAVTPADVQRVAAKYLIPVTPNSISNVPRGDHGALPGAVTVELP